MTDHKLQGLISVILMLLVLSVWISLTSEVYGGTVYEYIDKDGSTVITDNPPEGVSAKPVIEQPDSTVEQKEATEKDEEAIKQKYQEAEAKRLEKEARINAAREELEKAKVDADHYRSNMNQSANYSQRYHWRTMLDEQQKFIEEKQKLIDELEAQP